MISLKLYMTANLRRTPKLICHSTGTTVVNKIKAFKVRTHKREQSNINRISFYQDTLNNTSTWDSDNRKTKTVSKEVLDQMIHNTNIAINHKFVTPDVSRKALHSQAANLVSDNLNHSEIKQNLGIEFSDHKPIRSLKANNIYGHNSSSYKVSSEYEFKSPSMSVPKQRREHNNSWRSDFHESRSINSSEVASSNLNRRHITTGNLNHHMGGCEKRTISQIVDTTNRYTTLEPNTPTIREKRFELPELSRRSERKKRKMPMSSAERKLPECFSVRSHHDDASEDDSMLQLKLWRRLRGNNKFYTKKQKHTASTNYTLDYEGREIKSEQTSPRASHLPVPNSIYAPTTRPQNKFYMASPQVKPMYFDNSRFASIIKRGD